MQPGDFLALLRLSDDQLEVLLDAAKTAPGLFAVKGKDLVDLVNGIRDQRAPTAPAPTPAPAPKPVERTMTCTERAEYLAKMDPMEDAREISPAWVALSCDACSRDFLAPRDLYCDPRLCTRCLSKTLKIRRVEHVRAALETIGDPYASVAAAPIIHLPRRTS